MRYTIAAFRSHNEATEALYLLRESGINATLNATPASARVGCGASVRINDADTDKAAEIIRSHGFSTLAGLFSAVESKNGLIVTRL